MHAPSKQTRVGIRLGNFRIARSLGNSSTGEIFEAIQDAIGYRAVAKFFPGTLSGDEEQRQYAARFRDEAQAVNLINHPAAVKIFDFGEAAAGLIYILMEYVDGPSLRIVLDEILSNKRNRLTPRVCLQITQQIAAMMSIAHEKGIVHRDLKPENVILESTPYPPAEQRVRILDFGLARFLDSPERRTTAGVAMGTPMYMSPEQCYGKNLDGRADVYSLGCVLYEMLAGQPPFSDQDTKRLMIRQTSELPQPLSTRAPGLPMEVNGLVQLMLEKQPEQRPEMTVIASRIGEILAGGILGDSPTDKSASVKNTPRSSTHRRAALFAVAGIGLGVCGGIALGRLTMNPVPTQAESRACPSPVPCPEPALSPPQPSHGPTSLQDALPEQHGPSRKSDSQKQTNSKRSASSKSH